MEGHTPSLFENRVLKKVFGPKKEEVAGGWRKIHHEKLRNLYTSPNGIRVIKLRMMRSARHVARMGELRKA
jgi:hypothetical protein